MSTLDEAEKLWKTNERDRAHAVFEALVKEQPSNALAHQGLARSWAHQTRYDLAEIEAHKALELDPALPLAYLVLGIVRFMQKLYDQSEEALDRAIELDPANAVAYIYKAKILGIRDNRLTEAQYALNKALELDPGNYGAHWSLSINAWRRRDWGQAFQEARNTFRLKPTLVGGLWLIAMMLFTIPLYWYSTSIVLVLLFSSLVWSSVWPIFCFAAFIVFGLLINILGYRAGKVSLWRLIAFALSGAAVMIIVAIVQLFVLR